MAKPIPLEEMSPEEQEAEVARCFRAAWGVVIQSRNRRLREKAEREKAQQEEQAVPKAS